MKFNFDYPINSGKLLHGTLNVECTESCGDVEIDKIFYTPESNRVGFDMTIAHFACIIPGMPRLKYPAADVTELIEEWADVLYEKLQEAAEHHREEVKFLEESDYTLFNQ